MAEQKQETPQRIWLQWYGDGDPKIETGSVSEGDVTWCRDKIFEGDTPYVPESELARARQETWEQALKVAEYQFDTTGSGSMMLASMRKAAEVDLARDESEGHG